ncbi:MAG: hypothetical protein Q9186_005063 [Xanthomendoza sp. 1 TL-2023]
MASRSCLRPEYPGDLANGDAPPGVKENAWNTIQDAILGTETKNLRGMSYEMNAIKGKIMLWVYKDEPLERPTLYGKSRRSNVWGVLKEMIQTQKQFDDVVNKIASIASGFIKEDPDSQKAILKFLQDEPGKLRKAAMDRLALDLTDPPPENKKDSFFDIEDTSCTKDSPNKPKDEKAPKDDKSTQDLKSSVPEEAPDALKCHGVGGDVWMIHHDQADSAAGQFCTQDVKEKDVDHVKLTIRNTDDPSKPISAMTDCLEKFKLIIDGCDNDSPANNPHNYKFGGTYTTSDNWEFKLEPLAEKVTENSCDVSYKFALNKFEIRGKNFPDGKLGANGEGLKKEIEGCGALTKWQFKWTPNDVKYQWYASGQLPVGTKSCVGAATQSAGGKGAGHCKGAG